MLLLTMVASENFNHVRDGAMFLIGCGVKCFLQRAIDTKGQRCSFELDHAFSNGNVDVLQYTVT